MKTERSCLQTVKNVVILNTEIENLTIKIFFRNRYEVDFFKQKYIFNENKGNLQKLKNWFLRQIKNGKKRSRSKKQTKHIKVS